MPITNIVVALNEVHRELIGLYAELAAVETSIIQARTDAAQQGGYSTATELRTEMDISDAEFRVEAVRLRADIQIAEAKQAHYRYAIEHGFEQRVNID